MTAKTQATLAIRRTFAAAVLLIVPAAGCNDRSTGLDRPVAGGIAVIDLDAIAARLGSDKQIVAAIAERKTSLSKQLVELAKSYKEQITEQQKKLSETPAQENEVTLANWQQQANANLNKVKQQAELDLQKHRAALISQFREQIKPAARRVAQARGLSVIVTKNDNVLYDFSTGSDITEAVLAELQAAAAPQ